MAGNQSFGQVLAQIGDFLKGLSLGQRLLLAGGAVAVAATLFVFVRMIGKPEYKPLYAGMEPVEAQAMATRLKGKGVDFQLSPDGRTISVPASQLDSQRLEMASSAMPHSGRLGFELFDKTNWTGSDFAEKVNYQRALEGELERTIQTLSEVESARVHLVLPSDSLFAERAQEAKASVILKLRSHGLAPEAQATLARLVAGAVERLRPENVTVVDAETGRPLGTPSGGGAMASSDLEQQLSQRLVRTLEPVVGADRLRATVRVEIDPSTTEESEEKFDPQTVATVLHKREEESRGATAAGVPGAASNVPSAQGAAPRVNDASRVSRSEDGSYAVNRTQRRVVQPAGRIKRVAVALLVDDAIEQQMDGPKVKETRRKRTPEEMKQIEELARAALGLDTERGDQLSVQNLSFQQPLPVAPAPPPVVVRVRTELNRWSDVVRYVVIGLLFAAVYMLLLRPVKRQVMASLRPAPAPALAGGGPMAKLERSEELTEAELLPESTAETTTETQRIAAMKRKLIEKVKAEPAAATRLVQAWLHQEEDEA